MAKQQLAVEKYVRKPFAVDAVQVTEKNMYEVAKWCKGRVRRDPARWGAHAGQKYISVQVPNANSERQTQAYVGDWVLSSNTGPLGFKVYTPKAFENSFQKEAQRMMEVVERMDARAAAENDDEAQEEQLEFGDDIPRANPVR